MCCSNIVLVRVVMVEKTVVGFGPVYLVRHPKVGLGGDCVLGLVWG